MSGNKPLYANGWTASKATNIKSNSLAISIICLSFPFPFLTLSTISGNLIIVIYSNDIKWLLAYISRWWILFLGLLKNLLVNIFSYILFPTEGKPMRHIQVSQVFMILILLALFSMFLFLLLISRDGLLWLCFLGLGYFFYLLGHTHLFWK